MLLLLLVYWDFRRWNMVWKYLYWCCWVVKSWEICLVYWTASPPQGIKKLWRTQLFRPQATHVSVCDKTCKHSDPESETLLMYWMEEVLMSSLSWMCGLSDWPLEPAFISYCFSTLSTMKSLPAEPQGKPNEITNNKAMQCYLMDIKSHFRRHSQILIWMLWILVWILLCYIYIYVIYIWYI